MSRERFFSTHRVCCYCGGDAKAETIDHIPARITFRGKRRPKGLEVPAFESCNQRTKIIDLIPAMMCRIDPRNFNDEDNADLAKILNAIRNNDSPMLAELQHVSRRQRRSFEQLNAPDTYAGVLNASGPRTGLYMQKFGLKLGLALHYYNTGIVVPKIGGVAVRWFTNANLIENDFLFEILERLDEPRTLRQGKWHVSEEFTVSSKITECQKGGAYLSVFRGAFAICSFVYTDVKISRMANDIWFHRPGDWEINAWSLGLTRLSV
ncbi:MAG: hypothetical protein WAS21_30070 [Geminicoccaceae bacterium]